MKKQVEGFMGRGLFAPEHIKAVNEMRKKWKYIPYTKEGITIFFDNIRKSLEKDRLNSD